MGKYILFTKLMVFLLAISTITTSLPDFILPIYLPNKDYMIPPVLEIILIFYMLSKGVRFNIGDRVSMRKYFVVICPLLIAMLFEPIRYFINPGRDPIYIFVSFGNVLVFSVFWFVCVAHDREFPNKAIKSYWLFCYFIVLSSCLVFFLLKLGIVSISGWGLPSFFSSNYHIKTSLDNALEKVYSVPLYISVIFPSYEKPIPFFGEFGTFSGLSYEPHIATFFVSPAFFLTNRIIKATKVKSLLIYFPFLLFFILCFSLVNFICLFLVGLVGVWCKLAQGRGISTFFKSLFIAVGAFVVVFQFNLYNYSWFNSILSYFQGKVVSRSGNEVFNFASYLLQPKELFGFGVFNVPTRFNNQYDDIGIVGFTLFFVFVINIGLVTLKKLTSCHLCFGLSALYVILHSCKFPLHVLHIPFFFFTIILVVHSETFLNYGKYNVTVN